MQDSSFVQLIIYLLFHKELYPTFNINISKVLFTILFFFFPILVGYQRLYWIAIVNAFAVKSSITLVTTMNLDNLQRSHFPLHSVPFQQVSQVLCTSISYDLHEYHTSSRFGGKEARHRALFMALTEIFTGFLIYYTFLIWVLLHLCQLNSNKVEIIIFVYFHNTIFLTPAFAWIYRN